MMPMADRDARERLLPARDADRFDDDGGHFDMSGSIPRETLSALEVPAVPHWLGRIAGNQFEVIRVVSARLAAASVRQRKSWDSDCVAFDAILKQSRLLGGLVPGELRPLTFASMWMASDKGSPAAGGS